MSKNVEIGLLDVVLGHFEHVAPQNPLPARTSLFHPRYKSTLIVGRFAPEADFEARRVQNDLVQRLINRFQRSWTFFMAKIIPQIDSTHSETTHMHLRAVARLSVFFCTDISLTKVDSDFHRNVAKI